MPKSKDTPLQEKDAAAATTQAVILFDCGTSGNILVSKGIELKRLKLPVVQGKIIRAKTQAGKIQITQIGTGADHITILGTTPDKAPDEMHIRVPIGVRFYQVAVPKDRQAQGITSAYFFQTNDGYNILPHYIPMGKDPGQKVQELVLICSHVPPRSGPIPDNQVEDVTMLTDGELTAIKTPDAPDGH